jgi:phage anti-repressor protein
MQVTLLSIAQKVMSAFYEPVQRLEDIRTYTMPNGEEWSSVRDLYEYLELAPSAFARWCNTNIEKNIFAAKSLDYEQLNFWVELQNGGQKAVTEYAIHPDFAAKLAMVSTRSARAEEVRNFFVARNKKLNAIEQTAALPQTQDDLILMLAQRNADNAKKLRVIEAEQAVARQQLASVQEQVAEVAAKQSTIDTNYYTVSGWASKCRLRKTAQELNGCGRRAKALSDAQGYPVSQVYDAKYVTVNTYHVDILRQVFALPTTAVVRVAPAQPRATR